MAAFDPITAVTNLVGKGLDKFVRDKVDEGTMAKIEHDFQALVLTEARKEKSDFRNFVIQYEGSAEDYTKIPLFGPLLLLLRGIVRPGVTAAVIYFDSQYFTVVKSGAEAWPDGVAQILLWMNVLVLGFWFGERALKNTGMIDSLTKAFGGKK
mgnify:CR=1 FL=1